jgi:hypothetical protein
LPVRLSQGNPAAFYRLRRMVDALALPLILSFFSLRVATTSMAASLSGTAASGHEHSIQQYCSGSRGKVWIILPAGL